MESIDVCPTCGALPCDWVNKPADFQDVAAKLAALEGHVQNMGDAVAYVFEQMLRGKWVDDHNHDVRRNAAMLDLKDRLGDMTAFRAEHLGYSEP